MPCCSSVLLNCRAGPYALPCCSLGVTIQGWIEVCFFLGLLGLEKSGQTIARYTTKHGHLEAKRGTWYILGRRNSSSDTSTTAEVVLLAIVYTII